MDSFSSIHKHHISSRTLPDAQLKHCHHWTPSHWPLILLPSVSEFGDSKKLIEVGVLHHWSLCGWEPIFKVHWGLSWAGWKFLFVYTETPTFSSSIHPAAEMWATSVSVLLWICCSRLEWRLPSLHETLPSGEVAQSSDNSPCNIWGGPIGWFLQGLAYFSFLPAVLRALVPCILAFLLDP